ncbi:MAG: hypothetical protein D6794_04395, partial [Deltaproteobacteria bacterium]
MATLTVVYRRSEQHTPLLYWLLAALFIFTSVMVQAQEKGKTPDVILQQQARMKVTDEPEQQNTVELNQQGKNNAVRVQQLAPEGAPGNHLSVTQGGEKQVVVGLQRGTANTATTRQAGKENAVMLMQDGAFNQMVATQRGVDNQARVISQQAGQPPVIVQQRGKGNRADVILRNKPDPTDKPIQVKQS